MRQVQMNEPMACDVFIAGGGNSGMSAAISAADEGVKVILAEKANTLRSGAGATGNDHFQCYIPEVHGSFEEGLNLLIHDRPGFAGRDMDLVIPFMKESFEVVKEWDSWGINMKPHGYWEFTGHTLPWVQGTHLKYEGVNQKPILTREAKARGVKLLNRTPFLDLLRDESGEICGALCLDLNREEPHLQVIYAKSVILATTNCHYIAGNSRMGWEGNTTGSPISGAGEAVVAAYIAGASLVGLGGTGGMGNPGVTATRFMRRGGTRTWVGVYTDLQGRPYGPLGQETTYDVLNPGTPMEPQLVTVPDYKTGDYTQYLPESGQGKAYANGHPVFMNFSMDTDEDIEYMKWGLLHEGNSATLDHLESEGFDFRKHMIEFADCPTAGGRCGAMDTNGKGETNVPGLFAAGGMIGNSLPGLSPAVISGRIAGRSAAAYSKGRTLHEEDSFHAAEEAAERIRRILASEVSQATPSWQEADVAIRQLMWEYCGSGIVSEDFFELAHRHLGRIKEKIKDLHAATPHELMRCIGVQATAECADLAIAAGRGRKESRGNYRYADYPEPNHDYDGMRQTICKGEDGPVVGLRPIRTEVE